MSEPKRSKNGIWKNRIPYKDPITNEWKTKRLIGKTKKEVKQLEAEFLTGIYTGEVQKEQNLISYYDLWMETYKEGKVSRGRMCKLRIVRKKLLTFFGEKQTLRGVTKVKYQKFINFMEDSGLAQETLENYHAIARSFFIEAEDSKLIIVNPTRNAKLKGTVPIHDTAQRLSMEELKTFVKYLKNDTYSNVRDFVLLQAMTGARYQEIAALTWDDINFDEGYIVVNKAFEYVERPSIKEPKSKAGYRKIDVDKETLSIIKHHKIIQSKKLLAKEIRNPRGFCFVNNLNGMPISNNFVNRYIKNASEKANVSKITSHALRRTRTDLLILSGADPLYVKDQLGHEDYNTTLKYYASLSDELKNKSRTNVKDLEKSFL